MGGGGGTHLMHSRSLKTIDSHPYNGGTEHVGGFPTKKVLLAPRAKHSELFGESRVKGKLHPTKNHLWGGLRHLVPTFLLVDDNVKSFDSDSSVANRGDSNGHTV